jgi:hypothetical protein
MGFLDWFRRPPPIDDRPGLIDFLDTRAAYLTQKGIFDYVRATSGPHFRGLIGEPAFATAVDKARWQSYPLSLSMVTEMVHGVLRPAASGAVPLAEALQAAALVVIDRYPIPQAIGAEAWASSREELRLRLLHIGLHARKAVKDIPAPFAQQFFINLPIHKQMRRQDDVWVTNNLRVTLIRMYEEFDQRADPAALAKALNVARERDAVAPHG